MVLQETRTCVDVVDAGVKPEEKSAVELQPVRSGNISRLEPASIAACMVRALG